ncbi:MAG: hypothetical protein LQ352_002128 [Teloschistes flavicans]|nr:MAG: hypothetical protein LQ352_002128 [Teloschistes flavicans]
MPGLAVINTSPWLSTFFALSLLPASSHGFNCAPLRSTRCPAQPLDYSGPIEYPNCLVSGLSASAFIQCASQQDDYDIQFDLKDDKNGKVLDVLTQALSVPACQDCPLADKIVAVQKTIDAGNGVGAFVDFGANLCKQTSADVGMCCLKKCLGGSAEHSIQAFCKGTTQDLMQAPLLPSNCQSNGATTDSDTSGDDSADDNPPSAPPPTSQEVAAVTSTTASQGATAVTSAADSPPSSGGTTNSGRIVGPQRAVLGLAFVLAVVIELPVAAAF